MIFRPFVLAGGPISYGDSLTKIYHPVDTYIGLFLNGEKPADLPVQQATNVELVINVMAAKALVIELPVMLLARAYKVLE